MGARRWARADVVGVISQEETGLRDALGAEGALPKTRDIRIGDVAVAGLQNTFVRPGLPGIAQQEITTTGRSRIVLVAHQRHRVPAVGLLAGQGQRKLTPTLIGRRVVPAIEYRHSEGDDMSFVEARLDAGYVDAVEFDGLRDAKGAIAVRGSRGGRALALVALLRHHIGPQ